MSSPAYVLDFIGRPIGTVFNSAVANVKDLGAKGNDSADDTAAFLAAMETGLPIVMPPGSYLVDDQLLRSTAGVRQGLRMYGAGSKATFIRSSASSASALRMVKTDTGNFDWAAVLSGFTLLGNGGSSARGLEIVGQWHMKIDDLVIDDFTSDGFWIPERADLDPGSDSWSSQFMQVRGLHIKNCGGWGINDEGQTALAGLFDNCQIQANEGGGISTSTSTLHFRNSTIAYNGQGGSNGGLRVLMIGGAGPFALTFERCEFDSNYNYNEQIAVGSRITFIDCRDLSTEDAGPTMRPPTHTKITGADGAVVNLKFVRPARRATGTAALTWFDLGNTTNVSDVEITDLQDLGTTSALTRIANQGNQTQCKYTEYSGTVRSSRMRNYHLKAYRATDQAIVTATITRVAFSTIDAPPLSYGATALDAHFNTTTGVWTAPFAGRVQLRGYLSLESAWAGIGEIFAYVNGSSVAFRYATCQVASTHTDFPIAFDLDVAAGDAVDIRVRHAAGSDKAVKGGENQGYWTIEYVP